MGNDNSGLPTGGTDQQQSQVTNKPASFPQGPQRGGGGSSANGLQPIVVGIGASAGGLSALRALFSSIPPDSGVAYVVVVHLSPEHKSELAQLLQRDSPIPVQQVTEVVALEANNIYVIPPGRNLSTIDSHLRLEPLEEQRRKRAPIDHFFRTLAASHEGNSVGVILTGTGSDGALGIQEIKGCGGLTIAQEPSEAEYDSMPRSAVATGAVDLVLPLEQIIGQVLGFLRTTPRVPDSEPELEEYADARTLLQRILSLVHARAGRDFSRYKQSTIMRRIRRRMQLAHVEELGRYLQRLQSDDKEVNALAHDFLITVTSFFRDEAVYQQLERQVVPELFRGKTASDHVRVWSVGCATGEEAYSLAMLLLEEADRHTQPPIIQVFASDLQDQALKRAREGLYPGDIEADLTPERLQRFFRQDNGAYRIRKEARDLLVFAPHNLLVDPPFSKVDLILCRNVLIYLQRNLQPDIIELFHYALTPHGWLVLGTAESIDNSEYFTTENKSSGIYRKSSRAGAEPRLTRFPFSRTPALEDSDTAQQGEFVSFGALHHRMVERYAPPSILVNASNKVVHLSQRAGRYLLQPGGIPTTSVHKLVREELQVELQSALQLARDKGQGYQSKPVTMRIEGSEKMVTVQARPSQEGDGELLVLVIFDERDASETSESTDGASASELTGLPSRELETELQLTKRRLHAAIEEYEAGQEEMRASNEELQSANEELRSTLEELETSKEELQSINEELQTANQENRYKVAELSQLSDDLQHLMSATHIATLFIDRELRILRFTPQVGAIFSLRAIDRGRPLSDLTHRLAYAGLINDAREVLKTLVPFEREVKDSSGQWYLARMRPYRTAADRIDGVVLTFVDITARKASEKALRQSEERYRTLFNSMDEGFCVVEETGGDDCTTNAYRILETNPAFVAYTGLKHAVGRTLGELDRAHQEFWSDVCARLGNDGRLARFECNPKALKGWFEVCAFRLPDRDGPHIAILLKDISERKHTEKALQESARRDALRIALADAVRSLSDPNEIRAASCRLLRKHLSVESVAYIPLSSDPTQSAASESFQSSSLFRPWENNPAVLARLELGKPLVAADTRSLDELTPEQRIECVERGIRSYISVPIRHEGRLVSVFCVHHDKPRRWKDSNISLIEEMAERTWASSERARTELALRQREAALREADQRKDEFLAVLSHELRNPLTPITNSLRILTTAEPSGEQAKVAHGVIRRQVDLLTRLVNDLLDLTRVARGKIQLVGEDLELNELVSRTVDDHRSLFKNVEVTLQLKAAPSAVTVHGDANRLAQAIGNLLQNSAKFTGAGGCTCVTVTADPQRSRACISIADTGVGMTKEVVDALFQPFMQGESTLDRSNGGLGLGLALSKRLIELHDGEVRAYSEGVNLGAEFVIELPLLQPNEYSLPRAPAANDQVTPRRILIIEDNVDAAETLRQVLQYYGHNVAVAHEGTRGIAAARKFSPEIVLCDIGLPGMDGYTVATAFRNDPQLSSVFMIALSGYAMPEDARQALEAGFSRHVAKPPDIDHLQRLFAEVDVSVE